MMFFNSKIDNFPEFKEIDGEVYQLDEGSEDEDELIDRGEELVDKKSMPVSSYQIRQKEDYYGLYIR